MHFQITYTDQTTTPTNPLFCISLPVEHFSLSAVVFFQMQQTSVYHLMGSEKCTHEGSEHQLLLLLRTSEVSPECCLSSLPRQSLPPPPRSSYSLISSSTVYFAALELLSGDSQRMSERFGLGHWALLFGDSSLLCVAGFIQA